MQATWRTRFNQSVSKSGPLVTILAAVILDVVDKFVFSIPNAPSMLVTTVMFSAFHGGMVPGLVSAGFALAYASVYLSSPGHLFDYTHLNLMRLCSFAYIYPMEAWMTGLLKSRLTQTGESEKKLRGRMIATSKRQVLGELASGVAHDINSPLAIISFNAALLQNTLKESPLDKKSADKLAREIAEAARAISGITKSLRIMGRNSENDPFREVEIKSICEDSVRLCGKRFKKRDIQLEIEWPPEHLKIYCRPTEVSQVLVNLLNNAMDAAEKQPSRWVKISADELEHHYEISVTDSGLGIPLAIRNHIFSSFFTTKEDNQASGLGLSISKEMIERHHGRIRLDETSLHTRFVIEIPKLHTLRSAA